MYFINCGKSYLSTCETNGLKGTMRQKVQREEQLTSKSSLNSSMNKLNLPQILCFQSNGLASQIMMRKTEALISSLQGGR